MKFRSILSSCLLAAITLTPLAQQPSRDSLINIQISRNIATVNYPSGGSSRIGFAGTALLPRADGEAKVASRNGIVQIQGKINGLDAPQSFGRAYLVYVLWAITPEGRATSLGQLVVKGRKSKIDVTTKLQTFGLMVTAEPYFAVSFPSQKVILANTVLRKTRGSVAEVNASVELLQRGSYSDASFAGYTMERSVPLDLYQARNAVRIAALEGAQIYAPEALANAGHALIQAETYRAQRKKNSAAIARQAVQAAEDARSISITRQQQERIAAQQLAEQRARDAAQQAQQQAQLQADREAQQRALAQQQQALAEQQKAAADRAAAQAAVQRAAAEAAAKRAQTQARNARVVAAQAIAEKEALRQRLLDQFNRVLPTTDTSRGLVVNLGDVLFDTGKADLRDSAKIALARLSGILVNYPSLRLSIEGHADSTGTADFNQKLSERRADAVRVYVLAQKLPPESITVLGLGESNPVADNTSAEGRQKNRRVEIIVSGDVIGSSIGS